MPGIHVINPNSLEATTEAIRRAVAGVDGADGIGVTCHTSRDGPPGIASHAEFEASIPPLLGLAAGLEADALVVACFSDPGVDALRAAQGAPVIGIQEAAAAEAIAAGRRFGIVAVAAASVERQRRALSARGQDALWAGSRPLGLPVRAMETPGAFARMVEVGRTLRDADGAETLILGCAGMPDHKDRLEEALGLPVIEPCAAGVRAARGALAA